MFNESCSNYIYRETKEKGCKAGIKALKYRIDNCRPNYFLIDNNSRILLITAKNEVVEEKFIDKRILADWHNENSQISGSAS